MSKYIFIWVLITCSIYVYKYVLPKTEAVTFNKKLKQFGLSGLLSLIVIFIIGIGNNIDGL